MLELVLALAGTISANAAAGDVDPTFDSGANDYFEIDSLRVQPDGKIVALNRYLLLNGSVRGNLARLNSDGTPDQSFLRGDSQFVGDIRAIALQSDGKILFAGGLFRRLNNDGSLDTSFSVSFSPSTVNSYYNGIYALAIQRDGKILVGGTFTSVNGAPRNGIARLNQDGSLDSSFFNLNLGQNSFRDINFSHIVVQPDSKILVSYGFEMPDGRVPSGVARLNKDGTQDTTFASSSSDSPVLALALQPDGKVLVSSYSSLARFNQDGTLDRTFFVSIFAPLGGYHSIFDIAVQPDGKILVGGGFRSINGTPRSNLARLQPDGSLDETFLSTGFGTNGAVMSITLPPDGRVLVGGHFTEISDVERRRVVRLLSDQALAPTKTVSGRVTDATGAGVSSVTVALIGDFTGTHLVQTNEAGYFTAVHSFNRSVTVIPFRSGLTVSPQTMEFKSSSILYEDFTANFTATPATDPSPVPVLLTQFKSVKALALESVTRRRDPFPASGPYEFSREPTRISLFAVNLELRAGENVSALTVQAQNEQSQSQLPVEFIGTVPNFSWLTQIVVSLREITFDPFYPCADHGCKGPVRLTLKLRGKASNSASIR